MLTLSRCVVCPDEDYSMVVEMRAIEDLMDSWNRENHAYPCECVHKISNVHSSGSEK